MPETLKTKSPLAGVRVEISPSLDLWMRGARFGTIRGYDQARGIVTVAMDQIKRLQKIRIMDLSARTVCFQKWPGASIASGARVYFIDAIGSRIRIKDDPGPYAYDFCGWIDADQLEHET